MEINNILKSFIKDIVVEVLEERKGENQHIVEEKKCVYSLKELAEYCGCSKATVSRWKAEGKLRGCYKQIGRSLIFDLVSIDNNFKR